MARSPEKGGGAVAAARPFARVVHAPMSTRQPPRIHDFFDPVEHGATASSASTLTVGRSALNSLAFPEEMHISTRHLTLEPRADPSGLGRSVVVLHETSSNGTIVDGERLEKGDSARLERDCLIELPHSEEGDRRDFILYFFTASRGERYLQPLEPGAIVSACQALLAASALRSGGAGVPGVGTGVTSEADVEHDWVVQMLQERCDELAHETSRLAAAVVGNARLSDELAAALDREREARTRLDGLVAEMIRSMRQLSAAGNPAQRDEATAALHGEIERWEAESRRVRHHHRVEAHASVVGSSSS